jgi:hypothetical protein
MARFPFPLYYPTASRMHTSPLREARVRCGFRRGAFLGRLRTHGETPTHEWFQEGVIEGDAPQPRRRLPRW